MASAAKVLVVDDEPRNLLAFVAALEPLGHPVMKATSGEAALRLLLDDDVAVIILDVQMPGLDGFQTAELIRGRERSRSTPIIFLTAISKTESHVRHGYELGAVDYLFKPVDPDILRAKVAVFIELFRRTEEVRRQTEQIHRLETQRLLEYQRATHERTLLARERAAKAALEEKAAELERSNAELEQFAYVASHDMKEPLRMVASYTQLLARRYRGKLDEDADTYIRYATEGAERIYRLIEDLLALSRVGTESAPLRPTDAREVLDEALAALQSSIDENHAHLEIGELPIVPADRDQLVLVFQNLIANAIKFRGEDEPLIRITANRSGPVWTFRVEDNGIGIDPAFRDRIFRMFQRLHERERYPGSGIGLSIVKKVVHRHGGRVWVETGRQGGSAFCFTLPAESVSHALAADPG